MGLSIGEKVKVILSRRNMTLGGLADKIGQSRQNISNKFSRDNFTEQDAKDFAAALDCDFDAIFTMKDTGEQI